MRIEQEEDVVVVKRNKKKGLRLKAIEITASDFTVCDKCSLSCCINSLCNPYSFYLCDEVKNRGLGNCYFKLEEWRL